MTRVSRSVVLPLPITPTAATGARRQARLCGVVARATAVAVAGWLVAVTGAWAQPPQYTLVNLGTLGGSTSGANGINASGQVVGISRTSGDTAERAFLWDGTAMTDLGTLGGDFSIAVSINASGHAVGRSSMPGGAPPFRAFLWNGTTMTDLGTLGGGFSIAIAINDSGQIVGSSTLVPGNTPRHAFLWADGTMTDLGTLGGSASEAFAVNASGQAVGYSDTPGNAARHAVRWDGETIVDLGTLGGALSVATGINASGHVVGRSRLEPGDTPFHAFLWNGTTMVDLGTLGGSFSEGWAINAGGQAVGHSSTAGGAEHAFLWHAGVMYDINTLLNASSSGWTVRRAFAINDHGQIAAEGCRPGVGCRALRLDPNTTTTAIGPGDSGTPVDLATSGGVVRLTFDDVTSAGTATVVHAATNPHALGTLPAGLVPLTTRVFDVTADATFGTVTVCLPYTPAQLATAGVAEPSLRLLHLVDGATAWTDVASTVDPLARRVCATVSTLSPFVVAGSVAPTFDVLLYTLVDLGAIDGLGAAGSSWAYGISANGHVVGESDTASGGRRAFLHDGDTMIDLGTLGGNTSAAHAVNASGQVVGSSQIPGVHRHAFLWQAGTMTDLGTLGGTGSGAAAIDESGQVVGGSFTAGNASSEAFLWQAGSTMTALGVQGGIGSRAYGINASGQVVGDLTTDDGLRAFLWTAGTTTNLGTLGGIHSTARAINASGQVVGDSNVTAIGNRTHAFLWHAGTLVDLGTLGGTHSVAYAINASGRVVGYSSLTGGTISGTHGFLWQSGVMHDLNTLLDASSAGWTVIEAQGINDRGQIAARACRPGGGCHAVRLDPAPATTTTIGPPDSGTPVVLPTSGGSVTLTFNEVTTGGTVTAMHDAADPATLAPPPSGFRLLPNAHFDVTTTAVFDSLTLCIGYTLAAVEAAGLVPAELRLFHLPPGGGAWVDVTTSVDTVAQRVCGAVTTLSPFAIGGPVATTYTRYLAEGATSAFFDTRLALLNPGETATTATMTFLRGAGAPVVHAVPVPARTRVTVDPKTLPGLDVAEFSIVVESGAPLVVDRTMSWERPGYGSHAETSVGAPATTWYLAEGATHSGFELFYLLQNPSTAPTTVRVRYLLASGAPLAKDYVLPPTSRTNIWVNLEDFPGRGRALASAEFSAVIESLDDTPIIVERAMYLSNQGRLFNAGHESMGVTTPATQWFLAEGATGPFFDLFILIANPKDTDAEVTVTYLLGDGTTYTRPLTARANSRSNIWVDQEEIPGVPGHPLADVAVSTTVASTNGVPIIVERAMWWPGGPGPWHEAHNSAGATETGTRWALAEGEVGGAGATETYILIANTSAFAGNATVTLLFEDGTSASRVYPLLPNSRTNVPVASDFPSAANRRFGAIVASTGATPAQIVVERAMYSNAGGVQWAAGTNGLATRLP